ncbi:MAG TPA: hypothetical protein VGD27_10000 [Longimicrobiales bacterium]
MHKLLLIPLVLAVTACASGGASKSSSPNDRSVLTSEDIQRTGSTDAYSAVQALRPQWLTRRGTATINMRETIMVYLDGNLMGGPEQLRHINTHSISTIRHMDGLEATQRYGLDHGQGAILVYTRVGR